LVAAVCTLAPSTNTALILFCRFIWPLEAKLVCHDYVYDGTRLALAEMLLGGTTCINDMCAGSTRRVVEMRIVMRCRRYFYPRASSAAVMSVGARAGE